MRCEACGKGHQEWFEIVGSREGVEGVDEVIKRWIKFGEEYVGRDLGPVPKPSISAKAFRASSPLAPASTRKSGTAGTATSARQTRAPAVSTQVTPPRPKPQRLPAKSQAKTANTKPKKTSPQGGSNGRKKAARHNGADSDSEWGEEEYFPDQ